jgi:hypothetical protein
MGQIGLWWMYEARAELVEEDLSRARIERSIDLQR